MIGDVPIPSDETAAYLKRSFQRLKDAALVQADEAESAVLRHASAAGRLRSGSSLIEVKNEYERAFKAAAAKTIEIFRSQVGRAPESEDSLSLALSNLRHSLGQQFADFLARSSWAKGLEDRLSNEFAAYAEAAIEADLDDLRHGDTIQKEVFGVLEGFPTARLDVVDTDGTVQQTMGIVTSDLIMIPGATLMVDVGDEIRRTLPNGKDEVFDVVDPTFYEGFAGVPAHYQIKVRRKGAFSTETGGNHTFHVSGPNARVNFQSNDHSQNFAADKRVFAELHDVITQIDDPARREALTGAVYEMEVNLRNRDKFLRAYQNFMATVADHVTVFAPFLPALSQLIR